MKLLQDYKIVICPDNNGTFVAYVPAIKDCRAWGETSVVAITELDNVFTTIQENYQKVGLSLPDDVELTFSHH